MKKLLSLLMLTLASTGLWASELKKKAESGEKGKTSNIIELVGVITALKNADGKYFLKQDAQWQPNPEDKKYEKEQKRFLEFYKKHKAGLKDFFTDKELQALASNDATELTEFSRKYGFGHVYSKIPKGAFVTSSVLDVNVEWLKKGEKAPFSYQQNLYKGVKIKEADHYSILTTPEYSNPIIALKTKIKDKSNDTYYFTIADKNLSGLDLIEKIEAIRASLAKSTTTKSAEYIQFPFADYAKTMKLDWIKGLDTNDTTNPEGARVDTAEQQIKFLMDEIGARIKSETRMVVRAKGGGSSKPQPVIINQPFYVWSERQGLTLPIFYGYLDESAWVESKGGLDAVMKKDEKGNILKDEKGNTTLDTTKKLSFGEAADVLEGLADLAVENGQAINTIIQNAFTKVVGNSTEEKVKAENTDKEKAKTATTATSMDIDTNKQASCATKKSPEEIVAAVFAEVSEQITAQGLDTKMKNWSSMYQVVEKTCLDKDSALHKNVKSYVEQARQRGLHWPHRLEVLNAARRSGFTHEPTALKPDRMVCSQCKTEVYGWRPWYNFNAMHHAKCLVKNDKGELINGPIKEITKDTIVAALDSYAKTAKASSTADQTTKAVAATLETYKQYVAAAVSMCFAIEELNSVKKIADAAW